MKFHHPPSGSQYICIIDDVDMDDARITWHSTQEAAVAHAQDQYSNERGETYPDSTESGGNTYGEGETPNATVIVARVLWKTVL